MGILLSGDTFRRFSNATRKAEGWTPDNDDRRGKSQQFPPIFRWFELVDPLGSRFFTQDGTAGKDGYAKAKLLTYDPSDATDERGLADCYTIPTDAEEVIVHAGGTCNPTSAGEYGGYGYWGLPAERGMAKLIGFVKDGKVETRWEIIRNPGAPFYIVTAGTYTDVEGTAWGAMPWPVGPGLGCVAPTKTFLPTEFEGYWPPKDANLLCQPSTGKMIVILSSDRHYAQSVRFGYTGGKYVAGPVPEYWRPWENSNDLTISFDFGTGAGGPTVADGFGGRAIRAGGAWIPAYVNHGHREFLP